MTISVFHTATTTWRRPTAQRCLVDVLGIRMEQFAAVVDREPTGGRRDLRLVIGEAAAAVDLGRTDPRTTITRPWSEVGRPGGGRRVAKSRAVGVPAALTAAPGGR